MERKAVFTASIRGLSAISRFVLFLYLGRNVDPATIGTYGLISAICALAVQFIGLEFQYYNGRAILAVEPERRGRLIRDQLALHLLSYLVVLPWLSIIFSGGVLDWKYAIYFFPLVVFEHISQEVFRILVTCFRPVLATIVLFVRSGLWVFVFLGLMEYVGDRASLEQLLLIWVMFSAGAGVLGIWGLLPELSQSSTRSSIEWGWVQNGVKRSFPFLVTTVFFTALQFMDRFVLEYFHGEHAVGIFFFFSSLASFLNTVITFSVGVFHGPKVIYAYQNLNSGEYHKARSLFIKQCILVGGCLILPAIGAIYVVLAWVGKAEYYDYMYVYWIMLMANSVLAIADFVNFDLYVRGRDKEIMWSAVIAVVFSLILQVSFVPELGVFGAAIATTLSYMILGMVRYTFLRSRPLVAAGKS